MIPCHSPSKASKSQLAQTPLLLILSESSSACVTILSIILTVPHTALTSRLSLTALKLFLEEQGENLRE